jgi:multidrug efflux pump subunit AcrB
MRIQQPFNNPKLQINVNRTMAQTAGLQQRDVMGSLLVATSGSFQTSPTYYLDPSNGVEYSIATQSPQYQLDTMQDLKNIPLTAGSGAASTGGAAGGLPNSGSYGAGMAPSTGPVGGKPIQILGNVADIEPGEEQATVTHYNIQPVVDIFGNVAGTDLASVSRNIDRIIAQNQSKLPKGSRIIVRGQVQTMRSSFEGLLGGLLFSIVLVYLLIVVNFQSWLDPFIIITALPAAMAGIVLALFFTHTTISVPALMGAIMCVGVATANSILVVNFGRERLAEEGDAKKAALEAGLTRFRPVIMTALAMIIGMVPMALGAGEGGEQNAPLGRAVIGGLSLATVATLFFVPAVFSVLHGRRKRNA